MVTHKDRIVVLSILASASNHSSTAALAASSSPEDALSKNVGGGGPSGGVGGGGVRSDFDEMTPISPEFFNYAVALFVYSVRYPAVFWETNKAFSLLFSVQLMLGSVQSLLAFSGFSVFYKLHAYGVERVLSTSSSNADFVLTRSTAIILYFVSSLLVGLSGCVVYFYGLRKFRAFVVREREKHHISWRESSRTLWGYLPHCVAFVVLVLVAVLVCPLLSDYTTVYKGSLDGSILACVVGTIMFLFLWIVLWFTLTLKQQWRFRASKSGGISGATCNGGKTIRLSNEIELQRHNKYGRNVPLIVISHGQTFAIKEVAPKKAIMNVILKHIHQQKHHQQVQQRIKNAAAAAAAAGNDEVYWLRPRSPPGQSASGDRKKTSPSVKHKVTFEDTFILGGGGGGCASKSRKSFKSPLKMSSTNKSGNKQPCVKFEDLTDTDEDGEYATLRDIRMIRDVDDEKHDEACLEELLKAHEDDNDDDDYEDDDDDDFKRPSSGGRSPCLIGRDCDMSGHLCLIVKSPVHHLNVAVTVHDESPSPSLMCPDQLTLLKTSASAGAMMSPMTCAATTNNNHQELADESHEVTTTRSNSLSSSCSPPEKGASSDTSSGIHSSSSICGDNNNGGGGGGSCARKSSSMDDLMPIIDVGGGGPMVKSSTTSVQKPECAWKSMSLQRTSPSNYSSPTSSTSTVSSSVPQDSTMVILRKQWSSSSPKTDVEPRPAKQEPFGRATNMRLTSFTETPEPSAGSAGSGSGNSSSTLRCKLNSSSAASKANNKVGNGTPPTLLLSRDVSRTQFNPIRN